MIENRRVQKAGQNGLSRSRIAGLSANARPDGVALFDLLNIVALCCSHGLTLCRTVLIHSANKCNESGAYLRFYPDTSGRMSLGNAIASARAHDICVQTRSAVDRA